MDTKSTLCTVSISVFSLISVINLVHAAGYTITDLGSLGADSYGKSIAEDGQVAGYYRVTENGELRAFLYDGSDMCWIWAHWVEQTQLRKASMTMLKWLAGAEQEMIAP